MGHDMGTDFFGQSRYPLSLQLPRQTVPPQALKLPSNLSSYFKRPAKVAKTSGSGNSPHNIPRRRTTASHSTSRPRTLLKGPVPNHRSVGLESNDAAPSARPLSWHPNSVANTSPSTGWTLPNEFPDSTNPMHFMANPFATTQVHGLITPLTHPSSGESCYGETFTPLEEPRMFISDNLPMSEHAQYSSYWPSVSNSMYQHHAIPSNPYQETWAVDQQAPFTYLSAPDSYTGTAPPTPDLFPQSYYRSSQENPACFSPEPEEEGDEEILVGMGLYDTPLSPITTTTQGNEATSISRRSTGKGLKLEETFEPPSEDELDNDNAGTQGSDLGGSQFAQSQCLPPNPAASQPCTQVSQPANLGLGEQSFFFDKDPDEDDPLLQPFAQDYDTPIWTDVYTGAPCTWI